MLNSSRHNYYKKFIEALEEQIDNYKIELEVMLIRNYSTKHQIEIIDELITRILNITRKKAEGIKRNIPYS